jgi:hypothetical protein
MGIPIRRIGGWSQPSHWEMGQPTRPYEPIIGSAHMPTREVRMPVKTFCAFVGIYLAEGWTQKDSKEVYSSQSPKSRWIRDFEAILNAAGLKWFYMAANRRFCISSKTLGVWLNENSGNRSWGKYVPTILKDCPPDHLEELLRGLMIGDGSWNPAGTRRYPTASKRLADDVQEIFQKLSHDARVELREPPPGAPPHHRQMYHVHERLLDFHRLPPRPVLREYHGHVYAVATPNEVIYVRREGNPLWVADAGMEITLR